MGRRNGAQSLRPRSTTCPLMNLPIIFAHRAPGAGAEAGIGQIRSERVNCQAIAENRPAPPRGDGRRGADRAGCRHAGSMRGQANGRPVLASAAIRFPFELGSGSARARPRWHRQSAIEMRRYGWDGRVGVPRLSSPDG